MVAREPPDRAVHRASGAGDPRRAARGAAVAGRLAYVDASAIVKIPVGERQADALEAELGRWDQVVSSALLRVEATRACARVDTEALRLVDAMLARVSLLALDDAVLESAARLEPPGLRSLDAIHLATALSLGDDLGVFVAYDQRLLDAARAAGLDAVAPA